MICSTKVLAADRRRLPNLALLLALLGSTFVPPTTLAADDKQPSSPRVDAFGDPLPAGAIGRLGSTRFRHGRGINAIAWSPDGKQIASAGSWCTRVWEADTGKELLTVPHHHNAARAVAFSPDGKTLVTAQKDGSVPIRDVVTGKVQLEPRLSGSHLAFHPQGRVLAVGNSNGLIAMFDPVSGEPVGTNLAANAPIACLTFSRDGKRLMAVTKTGEVVTVAWPGGLRGNPDRVQNSSCTDPSCAALSPDGQFVALADAEKNIFVCQTKSGELVSKLAGHDSSVTSLAFSPDGQTLASGSWDRTLRGWDWRAGRERFVSHGHYGGVGRVAWSPDGKTIATSGRSGEFNYDRTIRLWDGATGKPRETNTGGELPMESIALSPDGKTAATGSIDTSVSLWDLRSGKRLRRWKQEERVAFTHVDFSPDGKTLLANGAQDVFLWQVPSGQLLGQFAVMGEHIRCVRFSPDGKSVTASDIHGGIVLANLADLLAGQKIDPLRERTVNDEVWSLAFTPDGTTLASSCWDKTVTLWDVASGQRRTQFEDHTRYVRTVAVSPDGRLVASGGDDETVYVREIATGRLMHKLNTPGSAVGLVFSPDSRTLIGGNYFNEVYLWDLATTSGDRFATLAGHFGGWVTELACARDGSFVAAASSDTTTLLWDLPAAIEQRTEQVERVTSPAELNRAWKSLSDDATADRAIWQLVESAPESISFLAGKLKPAQVAPASLEAVPQLIAELDAAEFAVRERALDRLRAIGPPARALLEKALSDIASFEQRNRIRRLLRDFAAPPAANAGSDDELPKTRAIYVLEHAGTPPAKQLLQQIADSSQRTAARHAAQAALERLAP